MEQVELGIRQVSIPNEVLNLTGIMDMTFMNNGRRMIIDIQGVELLLENNEQISLPSGHNRVYTEQFVRIKEPEVNTITRTYYSHPEIEGGALKVNRNDVYSIDYHNMVSQKEQAESDVETYSNQLNTFLETNHSSEFTDDIIGYDDLRGRYVWETPSQVGLASSFHIEARWKVWNGEEPTTSPRIGWSEIFLQNLTYEKLIFLRYELSNTDDPETIISKLTANNEVAEFDTKIGNNISNIINLANTLETEHNTIQQNLANSNSSLSDAVAFIDEWESNITETVKEFEVIDGVEHEIDPNEQALPINIKILYTKEATNGFWARK